MRSLSDTIARLTALRERQSRTTQPSGTRLAELDDFGSNPGALCAWFYLPEAVRGPVPLVVVLHGCTQTAAGYDYGSGWSQLADRHRFALLFPEQRRANNLNLCFNWYEPGDSRRDAGEPLSIRQMIEAMIVHHKVDPARIFVTGLSAGGAMTSVMLATSPELFAGGAIIAGLPYGSAASVPEAFDRMRGRGGPDGAGLAKLVRAASRHDGPWPSISVWHGDADRIVDAANGDAIVAQWRLIHGVGIAPDEIGEIDGHPHRVWRDEQGRAVIEHHRIAGMGHGTPLATGSDDAYGTRGAYFLDAGISSTLQIARSWGLVETAYPAMSRPKIPMPGAPRAAGAITVPVSPSPSIGVGKVIDDALRAAGLIR